MEFDDLIDGILKREGGYVKHTADRGGATNMGVTQRVFSDWLAAHGQQWRDVKTITKDDAVKIYYDLYWKNARCGDLPPSVRDIHFDSAVNHGVRRAALLLQGAAGASQDGIIGRNTLAAAFNLAPELLRMRYIVLRYRFYGAILQRDKTQLVFAAGWMARMQEFT